MLCGYLPFSGRCGEDCGWEDRGEECSECQHRLFQSIKSGHLIFPEKHWSGVSDEAKDLITKLLVRDASQRINATSILNHPWIIRHSNGDKSVSNEKSDAPSTALETPRVLRRRDSIQEIMFYSEFASNALAIKRNCDDQQGNVTLKKSMKKSATVSEFFEANHFAKLNTSKETVFVTKEGRGCQVEKLCQRNNDFIKDSNSNLSKDFGDDAGKKYHIYNANSGAYDSKNNNTFSKKIENQYPSRFMQRQQSYQHYLTHPSPLSKHMKRQTSLVVFAGNLEKGVDEDGCRWEF